MAPTSQVLTKHSSNVRTIILSRPQQLNALTLEMASQLLELLIAYERVPSVKLVILKGEGRAFCAGGDVAALANGSWKQGAVFFSRAYTIDYLVATYAKTQVRLSKP
ncbi:putative 3-hydroxyisobutyryl-CoA hydrolase [Helianthus anomalus]